jgi:hypothetical protein
VNVSRQERQALMAVLNGRQQLRNTGELTNEALNEISSQLSSVIRNTMLSLVP